MLVLIGSRALNFYGRLKGRRPSDWDFISDGPAFKKKTKLGQCEVSSVQDDETTGPLLTYCQQHSAEQIHSPLGMVWVAPIELLKALKLASKNHLDKAKHAWDLKQLEDIEVPDELLPVVVQREKEIKDRVESQKNQFFNKYTGVIQYLDHDWIHELINPRPIYTMLLVNGTDVSEGKFNDLTEEQKRMLIREECLVLSFERELIPKMKKAPFLCKTLVKQFLDTSTSNSTAMRWLSRMSIENKIKQHPLFCTNWTNANIDYILDGFRDWWEDKVNNMPIEFWEKILLA